MELEEPGKAARVAAEAAQVGLSARPVGVHTCCLTFLAATEKSRGKPCLGSPGGVCTSPWAAHFLGPVLEAGLSLVVGL